MAKNLRAKVPAEDTLFVHDVNTAATQKFLEENPTGVRVAENVGRRVRFGCRVWLC